MSGTYIETLGFKWINIYKLVNIYLQGWIFRPVNHNFYVMKIFIIILNVSGYIFNPVDIAFCIFL